MIQSGLKMNLHVYGIVSWLMVRPVSTCTFPFGKCLPRMLTAAVKCMRDHAGENCIQFHSRQFYLLVQPPSLSTTVKHVRIASVAHSCSQVGWSGWVRNETNKSGKWAFPALYSWQAWRRCTLAVKCAIRIELKGIHTFTSYRSWYAAAVTQGSSMR